MKKDRRDSVSSTSSSYSTDGSDSSASSSDNTEEFQIQIREREDPNQDYQRPELCKYAFSSKLIDCSNLINSKASYCRN